MITVENVSLDFGGRSIFNNISLQIKNGDRIGLIGNNGAGKTTFLKLISQNVSTSSGSIQLKNKTRIGYLPQEVYINKDKQLKSLVVGESQKLKRVESRINEINEKLIDPKLGEVMQSKLLDELGDLQDIMNLSQLQNKEIIAEKVMKGLGFQNSDFDREMSEFSGGWRMRAELSRLLVLNPDVLLLDEPTNHLDLPSIIWLEKFLKTTNCIIILVSHDKKFIDKIINRTLEVTNGKMKDYSGNYSNYMNFREKEISLQTKEKKKQDKYIKNSERLIGKFRYKKNKATFAQTLIRRLEKLDDIEIDSIDVSKISFNFPPPSHCGQIVYKSSGIKKSFGENIVFENVHLDIYKGDKIAFVGKNGCGKTTLTKIINNELEYEGNAKIGEKVEINYFAQNQNELLDGESTIIELLESKAQSKKQSELRGLLGAFLFSGDDVFKKIKVLSGGEKARLALCSLLLIPGNVLILDEPTNHLDMFAKDILKHALIQYEGTVILVSHDRDFLSGLADRVIEFDNGIVREFPGDIDIYLNQNNQSSKKKYSNNSSISSSKSGKSIFKEKKKIEKFLRQLNKKNSQIEKEISIIEIKLSELNIQLESLYNENGNVDYNQFNKLNEELNLAMINWENNQKEIINLTMMKNKLS